MADEPTPSDAPENEAQPDPAPAPEPPAASPEDALGDAGKAALKAERARAAKAEKERKALEARLAEIEAANQSEAEKAIAAARKEGEAEALSRANARILRAEIKAAAAGKLADPADAIKLLDLSEFEVSDDGEVDPQAIASAIDALVEQKPYLAATARPLGTGGGGARPATPPPSREQRIREAEAKGDLKGSIHGKSALLVDALMNPT